MPTPNLPADFVPRSDLVRTLLDRGHVYQATDLAGLDAAALKGPVTAYIGFDATAPSLHVGSLVQIMTLRRLQQTGHRPIVLMGGGTTKVGDPSDKTGQRPLLTETDIAANLAGIRRAFGPFLTFGEGPTDAVWANNADWLEKLGYIEFLRDYGVHFTINKMLSFEFVKNRLQNEQPLTFLEFNYMLMQAADFLELNRRFGCALQFGGSEQWGNIVNGVDLIRRLEGREAFGVTAPLVTTASGVKMGKTVAGAVWLNAEMRSPYEYWQFWRNSEDADVGRFLRLFTDLPLDEVTRLETLAGAEINEAKKILADAATSLLHGEAAAVTAAGAARAVFEEGRLSADLPTLKASAEEIAAMANTDLMVWAGFATSKGDARRQIAGGAFRIDGVKVAQADAPVDPGKGPQAELRKGQRQPQAPRPYRQPGRATIMSTEPAVGEPAPDFDLPGDTGPVSLKALAGKSVVLYFYPKDDTSGCTAEAQAFTAAAADFEAAGAVVVGLSKDSPVRHGRFRAKYGLTPLLASDTEGEVVARYGAWVEKSLYGRKYMGIERRTYLIDGHRVVRRIWRKVKVTGHVAEVLRAVAVRTSPTRGFIDSLEQSIKY